MIPLVAASERGGAQTCTAYEAAAAAVRGLDGVTGGLGRAFAYRLRRSRNLLERGSGEGERPVGDGVGSGVRDLREYRRTRDIRREAGRPTAQG